MAEIFNRKSEKTGLHDDSYATEEFPLTAQPKKNEIEKVVQAPSKFGYKPVQLICSHCHSLTTTNLAHHITGLSQFTVFVCSLATWPCGLCFLAGIPFCLDCCQKVDHHCSVCNAIVGEHSKW